MLNKVQKINLVNNKNLWYYFIIKKSRKIFLEFTNNFSKFKKTKERQNMKNNSTLVQNKVLGGGVTINN